MAVHPAAGFQVSPFRTLDPPGYKEQQDLLEAESMDDIYKMFASQEGTKPAAWTGLKKNPPNPIMIADTRSQMKT